MRIHWLIGGNQQDRQEAWRVNTEYALQLQVRLLLIREADDSIDRIHEVVLHVEPSTGKIQVDTRTPEPLFSILSKNLHRISMTRSKVNNS